jgi:hypothetical protein
VIEVTQSAKVATHFLSLFGINALNVSATAAASKAGGYSVPLNIMFIIDGTGSMSQADDSGCTTPLYSHPTKFQCAEYGVQLIMQQLTAAQDRVGLMTFPGTGSTFVPCGSQPSSVPYGTTGIVYEINSTTSLDTGYNDGNGHLIDTDPLVKAVGDAANGKSGCLANVGGEATFYAEAISKAQVALVAQGKAGTQNVIIILSDGAANSTKITGSTWSKTNECQAGVTQAGLAISAGTWVYTIAYDATTNKSDCTTDSNYTPCEAMENMASDATKYFSASSATGCTWSSSPNTYTSVANAFKQIAYTLQKPRLILIGS